MSRQQSGNTYAQRSLQKLPDLPNLLDFPDIIILSAKLVEPRNRGIMKTPITQLKREIASALFTAKLLKRTAYVLTAATVLLLAQGITLVTVFAALFLLVIGAGGCMILAEVALDQANRTQVHLSYRLHTRNG